MIKFATFYKKKPPVELETFREWLLAHGERVSRDPNLKRYWVNFVNEVRLFNLDPKQMEYDATSEQWFDSEDDVERFQSRLIVNGEAKEIERMCLSRTAFLTEEHVIIDGPDLPFGCKLVVLLQRRPDLSVEAWRDWWLAHTRLAAQIPGLRAYRINFITKAYDEQLEEMGIRFDGTAQLWFDSVASMEAGFCSSIGKRASADSDSHCGKRARFLTEEHRFN